MDLRFIAHTFGNIDSRRRGGNSELCVTVSPLKTYCRELEFEVEVEVELVGVKLSKAPPLLIPKGPHRSLCSDFHGPYNNPPNIFSPLDSQYTVVPHFMQGSRESADVLALYELMLEIRPMFMLEVWQGHPRPLDTFPDARTPTCRSDDVSWIWGVVRRH